MRGVDRVSDGFLRKRPKWRVLAAVPAALVLLSDAVLAQGPATPPTIRAGAIELGIAGSMTTAEGVSNGSLGIRSGTFFDLPRGMLFGEVAASYRHVSSLDVLDAEANVGWQHRVGAAGNYPYVSVGGGLRYEDIGSFGQTRYPLGFAAGLRTVLGQWAGLRLEYRFRRILNDPVSNFFEHHLTVGVSVFFRNGAPGAKGRESQ